MAHGTTQLYRLIQAETTDERSILVAPGLSFAARIENETLGLPLVTMHLQPSCFLSVYETAVLHRWLASINR